MGKYSSDSDNEKRVSKHSYKNRSRRRSTSSSSSDSSSRRRRRKQDRHRSCDKYPKSRRSRSHTKSHRYSSKYKRSHSRERHHRLSHSKTRHHSRRSRSKSYIKEYVSKPKRHSSSSSSSSSSTTTSSTHTSNSLKSRNNEVSNTTTTIASTANVAVTSQLQRDKSPELPRIDSKVLNEINDENFTPKQFTSNSTNRTKKVPDNIVIDLNRQTIKVPEVEPVEPDSIFHHNLFINEEARVEKWVKELYCYRQKALQQGLHKRQ